MADQQDKEMARKLAERAAAQGKNAVKNAGRAAKAAGPVAAEAVGDAAEAANAKAEEVVDDVTDAAAETAEKIRPKVIASMSGDTGVGFLALAVSIYSGTVAYHKFAAAFAQRKHVVK